MKVLSLFISLLIILSCGKDESSNLKENTTQNPDIENPSSNVDDNEAPAAEGNIKIDFVVELPEGSAVVKEDLAVSSLFSPEITSSNNVNKVEVINNDGLELVTASSAQDELVLMGYINPVTSNMITLNSETTAIAIIMMHPWTFELSTQQKIEAMEIIKKLPDFEAFKSNVEESIKTGKLEIPDSELIIQKINSHINSTPGKIEQTKEPLKFEVDGNIAKVSDNKSLAAYGIAIRDQEFVLIESKLLLGNEGGNTYYVEFDIPVDGRWNISAKNGLPYPGYDELEHFDALYENVGAMTLRIFGLFSGGLSKGLKAPKCLKAIGQGMANNTVLLAGIGDYKLGKINSGELFLIWVNALTTYVDSVITILTDCSKDGAKVASVGLKKALLWLGVIFSAKDGGEFIYDWVNYEDAIDFCFIKDGDEISFCDGLILGGNFDFGEVPIGESKTKKLTIFNNLDFQISLSAILLPEGFTADLSSAEANGGVIKSQETITVDIIFTPVDLKDYSEVGIIENDYDQVRNKIDLKGIGIQGSLAYADWMVVKKLFEANGIDVSDPNWDSMNTLQEAVNVVFENNCNNNGINIIGAGSVVWRDVNQRITKLTIEDSCAGGENRFPVIIIPPEIGNLSELTEFKINYTSSLSYLPPEIGNLSKLEKLIIEGTGISYLPQEIQFLTNLKEISIISNHNLTIIPSWIGNLNNVFAMNLTYNNLSSLPVEIADIDGLYILALYGNPSLLSIPCEIWYKSSPQIINISADDSLEATKLEQCFGWPLIANSWKMNVTYQNCNGGDYSAADYNFDYEILFKPDGTWSTVDYVDGGTYTWNGTTLTLSKNQDVRYASDCDGNNTEEVYFHLYRTISTAAMQSAVDLSKSTGSFSGTFNETFEYTDCSPNYNCGGVITISRE